MSGDTKKVHDYDIAAMMQRLAMATRLPHHVHTAHTAEMAIDVAAQTGEWDAFGEACLQAGVAFTHLSEHDAAIGCYQRFLEHCGRFRDMAPLEPLIWFNRGISLLALGRLAEAEQSVHRGFDAAARYDSPRLTHGLRHLLIRVYLAGGQLTRIPPLLARTHHYIRHYLGDQDQQSRVFHFTIRAEFALARGRHDRAAKLIRRHLQPDRIPASMMHPVHLLLSRVALAEGKAQTARTHANALLRYALAHNRRDLQDLASTVLGAACALLSAEQSRG